MEQLRSINGSSDGESSNGRPSNQSGGFKGLRGLADSYQSKSITKKESVNQKQPPKSEMSEQYSVPDDDESYEQPRSSNAERSSKAKSYHHQQKEIQQPTQARTGPPQKQEQEHFKVVYHDQQPEQNQRYQPPASSAAPAQQPKPRPFSQKQQVNKRREATADQLLTQQRQSAREFEQYERINTRDLMPKAPQSPEQRAHRNFVTKVNQNDLQAQVYMKTIQQRQRQYRVKQIATKVSVPTNLIASVATPLSQQPPMKASSRQRTAMELTSEVADLKKQRNKDQEDVRFLKVEMVKLEQAYKRYKQVVPKGFTQVKIELPDFVKMTQTDATTEEIMIEVARVKNLLQVETNIFMQQNNQDKQDIQRQQNQQFKQTVANLTSSIKAIRSEPGFQLNTPSDLPQMIATNYPNVSTQRLALTNLKQRAKSLEKQIRLQEEEIDRLSLRTNEKAIDDLKSELKKSYEVMSHLKKKINQQAENPQFNAMMTEIAQVLNIPQERPPQVRKSTKNIQQTLQKDALSEVNDHHTGRSFTLLPPTAWKYILSFMELKDMFPCQSLCIKVQSYVNPSSLDCQVDYKGWFDLQTKRRITTYGSLLFILQESDHFRKREQLEINLQLRNEREAQMIIEYDERIKELQEELDLDQSTFADKFIQKLKQEVETNKRTVTDHQRDMVRMERHQLILQAQLEKEQLYEENCQLMNKLKSLKGV